MYSARQFITHGHIQVNGKRVDIPSYSVSVGQVITVREKSKNMEIIKSAAESLFGRPEYVTFDLEKLEGSYNRLPLRDELSAEIYETIIVEYYSR
jgi:small subunit ribosomal protein S4